MKKEEPEKLLKVITCFKPLVTIVRDERNKKVKSEALVPLMHHNIITLDKYNDPRHTGKPIQEKTIEEKEYLDNQGILSEEKREDVKTVRHIIKEMVANCNFRVDLKVRKDGKNVMEPHPRIVDLSGSRVLLDHYHTCVYIEQDHKN
jgi:hypothetical protein